MDETPVPKEVTDLVKTETKAPEVKDAVENMAVETYEPKKNCKKCYGTGRLGFIEGDPNKPYYCNCIMKIKKNLTTKVTKVEPKNEPQASV